MSKRMRKIDTAIAIGTAVTIAALLGWFWYVGRPLNLSPAQPNIERHTRRHHHPPRHA
jgi:hypothetical protein